MKDGKVWGRTRIVDGGPFFELHRLFIKPNHECSLHVHKTRSNGFHVIRGRLFVDVVKNDYPLTDTTELGPDEEMVVRAGEHHKFRTGNEECEAFEWYAPMPLGFPDIDRKGHGGPVEDDAVSDSARR